jgi:hypothetical protein
MILAGVALLVAVLAWAVRRAPAHGAAFSAPRSERPIPATPRARLAAHIAARRDYAFSIGVPLADPQRYARAELRDGSLQIDGEPVDLDAIQSWLIAYPNGEPLDSAGRTLGRPPGVTSGLEPSGAASLAPEEETIDDAAMPRGTRWIRVTHGQSAAKPNSRTDYATTLENVSRERVRVLRFGAYRRVRPGLWRLHTVTNILYDAAQFRTWYGLSGEWIEPNGRVTDPNNYGGRPVLWAYFCETEGGERFIAGGALERDATTTSP